MGQQRMFDVTQIGAEQLHELKARGCLRLIDVRGDTEVARGMIEGAEHISLHLLPLRAGELSPGVPIVFYCQSGARSMQACALLRSRGHANVYNLRGGIMAWLGAGETLAVA